MDTATPLSHHAILALVAPFVRAGWVPELAASDRAARRIAFRPVVHAAAGGLPALHETRTLEGTDRGGWRLVRRLAPPGPASPAAAPAAEVLAEGPDAAALLQAVAAVPVADLFLQLPDLPVPGTTLLAALALVCGADGRPRLAGATADVAGLRLEARVTGVKGYPAELTLTRPDGDTRRLPDDLFEVLGRAWTRLVPLRTGWEASVMPRGAGQARSADALARIERSIRHLAQTLAEPPARFHERHRAARWRVGLARGAVLGFGVAIVAFAFAMRGDGSDDGNARDATLGALANLLPPVLMALFFLRREMPRVELPRVPRRPPATSWQPWTPSTDPPLR